MRNRHAKKLLSSGLALIALACVWFYFAPVGLGGSTSYVVTDGISMQPRFHSGDLALVRSRGSYNVGEIVAYNSRTFHTIVLHRIVARAGSRYVFKGDNNNFVDFEHPAQSQLIGALWLHVPGVGAQLESLRSPALIGVLVGVGMLLLGGAAFTQRRRLRRRQ
ncbi:MAG: signal peptidase I, partial [Solirubrobacterales bacterium]